MGEVVLQTISTYILWFQVVYPSYTRYVHQYSVSISGGMTRGQVVVPDGDAVAIWVKFKSEW